MGIILALTLSPTNLTWPGEKNPKPSKQEEDQENKVKSLADQLKKVHGSSVTQMENTAVLHDRRQTDIKQSETRLHIELNADRQSRKETEVKTGKIIDEKLYSLRLELAKEKKAREECNNRCDNTYGA